MTVSALPYPTSLSQAAGGAAAALLLQQLYGRGAPGGGGDAEKRYPRSLTVRRPGDGYVEKLYGAAGTKGGAAAERAPLPVYAKRAAEADGAPPAKRAKTDAESGHGVTGRTRPHGDWFYLNKRRRIKRYEIKEDRGDLFYVEGESRGRMRPAAGRRAPEGTGEWDWRVEFDVGTIWLRHDDVMHSLFKDADTGEVVQHTAFANLPDGDDDEEVFSASARTLRYNEKNGGWSLQAKGPVRVVRAPRGGGRISIVDGKSGKTLRQPLRRVGVTRPHSGCKRAYVWTGEDSTRGTDEVVTLCAKFPSPEVAKRFQTAFESVCSEAAKD